MPEERVKFALRISPELQKLVKDICPRKLRIKCAEDAKRTNGSITLVGVIKSQRGRD